MRLPLSTARLNTLSMPAPLPAIPTNQPNRATLRALLAEDIEDVLETMEMLLNLDGFEVAAAKPPREATERFTSFPLRSRCLM